MLTPDTLPIIITLTIVLLMGIAPLAFAIGILLWAWNRGTGRHCWPKKKSQEGEE